MRAMKVLLAAAIVALVGNSASAQVRVIQIQRGQPGVGAKRIAIGGFAGRNYYQLRQKAVQEDLKLTKEQIKKIEDTQKAQQAAQQEVSKLRRDPEKRAEAIKKMQEINKKTQDDMAKILTKEQSKRLDQIQFQQQTRYGMQVIFRNQKYVKDLKVTKEQQEKAQEIQKEQSEATRNLPRNIPIADRRKAIEKIRDESSKKMEGILTKEQQKKLEDLRGKPFKGLNNRANIGGIRVAPVRPIQIKPGKIQIKPIQGKNGKIRIQVLPVEQEKKD